MKRNLKKGIIL